MNFGEAGDSETKLIPKTILLTVQHPLINGIDIVQDERTLEGEK